MIIETDREFNQLMRCDIKIKIAEAFIRLESNIRPTTDIITGMNLHFKELVEQKAEQMKGELSAFIDSQSERIINSLKQ